MANPSRGRPLLTGSVRRIRLRSSIGFGGATKSEFAEFLLHFPTEEIFQSMRYAEFFVKHSLACRIRSHPSCLSNFSILFKLHLSI